MKKQSPILETLPDVRCQIPNDALQTDCPYIVTDCYQQTSCGV